MKRSDCGGKGSGMNSGPVGRRVPGPVGGLIYIRVSLRFIMASHGRSVSHCTIAGGGKEPPPKTGGGSGRPSTDQSQKPINDTILKASADRSSPLDIHQRRPLLEQIAQPGRSGEDAAVPSYWMDLFTPETWDEIGQINYEVTGFRANRRAHAERAAVGDFFSATSPANPGSWPFWNS